MYFSKSTTGFYTTDIHGDNMPEDIVEIDEELYRSIFEGLSKGMALSSDSKGFPILIEAPITQMPYTMSRLTEYPPITDYIDGIVKGDQAQVDAYIATCLAVKAKYPKP